MRPVLVRHGEGEAGLRGIVAGLSGCTGLSDLGRRQAHALAERLRTSGELNECQVVLCSPLLRARQTADIPAPILATRPATEDCDLCELHPGEADGLSWEMYAARYGAFDM